MKMKHKLHTTNNLLAASIHGTVIDGEVHPGLLYSAGMNMPDSGGQHGPWMALLCCIYVYARGGPSIVAHELPEKTR